MATIEKFKKVINGVKHDVYPVTLTAAVVDASNNNLDAVLAGKQDNLVSGTNIKTINGDSVVGSGNLTITTVNGHTVGANVPADASFTDHITDVSVTGTGNAVTSITADTNGHLSVVKNTTFLDSIPVASSSQLGGIKVGNGLSISNGVLSANAAADVSVTQTPTTTAGEYPILIKNTTSRVEETDTVKFSSLVHINPNTGLLKASKFAGNGSTLTNVDASKVSGHTVGVNVPSNAVFTDTISSVTVTGTGNGIASISDNGSGQFTATKTTFLTDHQSLDDYAKTAYVDSGDTSVLNAAKTYTDSLVTSAVRIKGVMSTVAEVLAVTTAKVGDMYIVTADNSEWVCIKDISVATANAWEMLGKVDASGVLYKDTNVFTDGYVLEADGTTGKVKAVQATASLVGLGNVTNNKQIKGLASGTTANHVVTWGTDGYSVKDSGYTIGKSVPSNAVFTDTITSATTTGTGNAVTSVTADASGQLTVTKGDTFLTRIDPATTSTLGGVIVGSGLSVDSLGVLSSNATDTKVTQTAEVSSSGLSFPILTKYSNSKDDETNSVRWTNSANYTPSTGTLSATMFSGDGTNIRNVDAVTVAGYTVGANVPAGAKFTDSSVLQTESTANESHQILLKWSNNATEEIQGAKFTRSVTINTQTGVINAQGFRGSGASLTNVDASTVSGHSVSTDVPSNAVFTDTQREIQINGVTLINSSTSTPFNIKSGSNVTLTRGTNGDVTISSTGGGGGGDNDRVMQTEIRSIRMTENAPLLAQRVPFEEAANETVFDYNVYLATTTGTICAPKFGYAIGEDPNYPSHFEGVFDGDGGMLTNVHAVIADSATTATNSTKLQGHAASYFQQALTNTSTDEIVITSGNKLELSSTVTGSGVSRQIEDLPVDYANLYVEIDYDGGLANLIGKPANGHSIDVIVCNVGRDTISILLPDGELYRCISYDTIYIAPGMCGEIKYTAIDDTVYVRGVSSI